MFEDFVKKIFESFKIFEFKGEIKSDLGKKECDKVKVFNNVIFKGGKKVGKFNNYGDVKGMEECQDICCKDGKCYVVFMFGKMCYFVICKNKEFCEYIKVLLIDFNLQFLYVRFMEIFSKKGELICQKNLRKYIFENVF